jgi:hypothetical protein
MTIAEQELTKQSGYAEAMRYIANAKEALKKAGKDGRDGKAFKDRKYVRSASGTAYSGVLVALDAWLELKGVEVPKEAKGPKSQRNKTIKFYRAATAGLDKKMLRDLNLVYESLHLSGYYDGTLMVSTIKSGFEVAEDIINRIKPKHAA